MTEQSRKPILSDSFGGTVEKDIPENVEWIDDAFYIKETRFGLYTSIMKEPLGQHFITGATRGIGRGIAETFAKQGANVLFTYSSSSDLAKEIEKELSSEGVVVRGYKSDASSFEDCQKLIDGITQEFDVVDILINNAGITRDNLLMRMQEDDFDKVIEVNLKSVFNMTKLYKKQC